MRTTEVSFEGRLPVDGYGPGGFRVAGAVHLGALALLPEGVVPWGGPPEAAPFLERAGSFDVLILGTGATAGAPSEALALLRAALEAVSVAVETMPTPSACRTYNVLLAEGRRVAAALVPV